MIVYHGSTSVVEKPDVNHSFHIENLISERGST